MECQAPHRGGGTAARTTTRRGLRPRAAEVPGVSSPRRIAPAPSLRSSGASLALIGAVQIPQELLSGRRDVGEAAIRSREELKGLTDDGGPDSALAQAVLKPLGEALEPGGLLLPFLITVLLLQELDVVQNLVDLPVRAGSRSFSTGGCAGHHAFAFILFRVLGFLRKAHVSSSRRRRMAPVRTRSGSSGGPDADAPLPSMPNAGIPDAGRGTLPSQNLAADPEQRNLLAGPESPGNHPRHHPVMCAVSNIQPNAGRSRRWPICP